MHKQLEKINVGKRTKKRNMLHFHKAFYQINKWVAKLILNRKDIDKYDKKLRNKWKDDYETKFDKIEKLSVSEQIDKSKDPAWIVFPWEEWQK